MIGFDDSKDGSYALVGEKQKSRNSNSRYMSILVGGIAFVGVILLVRHATIEQHEEPTVAFFVKYVANPADPCLTLPFAQCSGMNFTKAKATNATYNITAGLGTLELSTCCPAGTTCSSFGPVWGMCMPAFVPTTPSARPGTAATKAPEAQAAAASAPNAAAPIVSLAIGEPFKPPAFGPPAGIMANSADPCKTKPFGQCSGMNFTMAKATNATYNITAGLGSLELSTCCPAGTTCSSFGPVWGMCMPAFAPTGPPVA